MKTKYGLFCGDFHCGHRVGITPSRWEGKYPPETDNKLVKWQKIRKALWRNLQEILEQIPPIDFLVVNGDMVDGKAPKSGATELLTSSIDDQCDMAVDVVRELRKKSNKGCKTYGTFGTDYHTQRMDGDDSENRVAKNAGFESIGSHEWLDVNGLIFDIRHHIGNSSVPYGIHTQSAKSGLFNDLWALQDMQPRADVLVRSHVHIFQHCGTATKLCMTLPAMQGMGSKFGSRRCMGLVDWGFVLFEVTSKTDYKWYPFIRQIKAQQTKAVKV